MSEVRHQWNGSILTVISDSGASSADLLGPKGDMGPRGPQGPAGVVYNEDGELIVDLSRYYTIEEVDAKVANVKVDLSNYATKNYVTETVVNANYATKNYVSTEIAKAQLAGVSGDVDLSGFVTEDELNRIIPVDGVTITYNEDGQLTVIGGGNYASAEEVRY